MEDIKIDPGGTLSILCFDSIDVRDKTTFLSYLLEGLQVTHWLEETDDVDARVGRMFDILFGEVIKK